MADTSSAYRVLARKYRPQSFDDLIGQSVLVRTLANAFSSGRIAHAFLLTGIRGIGKTTTARIIARGLNCIGPDGQGGPTTSPCGQCPNCEMILKDRHVDVIEMDAASRTGVDDIREIIDTVHYAPTSARYKVYIIDEIHMLSKNAFNALLKTLEEPPAHVKFIFATTELRKLPVTIISRCQRFDLRRLEIDTLAAHLGNICGQESVTAEKESLELISVAAEGSVRDALSLLDQGIAISADASGNISISADTVRDMLGLADKTRMFTLLNACFKGESKVAIDELRELYRRGSDPLQVLQDMLELVHFITRVKLDSVLADNVHYSDLEQQKAKQIADGLDMAALTRCWQMLLKGIGEVKQAPQPIAAAEMILIRLGYASTLPSPDELIRQLDKTQGNAPADGSAPTGSPAPSAPAGHLALATQQAVAPQPAAAPQAEPTATIESFRDAVALFEEYREPLLFSQLYNDVRFVSLTKGCIEVRPTGHLPADFAARISRHLTDWCGEKWILTFSQSEGEPTLHEQALKAKEQRITYAQNHPDIQTIIATFPGARVMDVVEDNDEPQQEQST